MGRTGVPPEQCVTVYGVIVPSAACSSARLLEEARGAEHTSRSVHSLHLGPHRVLATQMCTQRCSLHLGPHRVLARGSKK